MLLHVNTLTNNDYKLFDFLMYCMQATMSVVDRKRLLNALELRRKNVCEKFTWGFQFCFPKPSLSIKSFYVNEIGTDVSVPVSYQVFTILK